MDEELLKKDLKGRQKKIEKLTAENYVLRNRLEVAEDNLDTERRKNIRLYNRYIITLKELAQYKKDENDNTDSENIYNCGKPNIGYWIYEPIFKGTEKLICSNCGKPNHCKPKLYCFECGSKNNSVIKRSKLREISYDEC